MPGTTPIYSLPYPVSSDLVSAYPALGQDLAEDLDDILAAKADNSTLGLKLITAGTWSAAGSLSVNSVFSSTYRAYRLDLYLTNFSTGLGVTFRLRASGTDSTAGYYGASFGGAAASATTNYYLRNSNSSVLEVFATTSGNGGHVISLDVFNPNGSVSTTMRGSIHDAHNGNGYFMWANHNVTSAYDGFSLVCSTGTFGGVYKVFGYHD